MTTREKKKEIVKLKSKLQRHSLLWVWEFSKKALLICFIFWMIVQLYTMYVMYVFNDFTYLGSLIEKAGDIVENCVFGYLVKAGVENFCKICFTRNNTTEDEPVG